MEITCHSWAFNDLTLPEALGTIARLGFRYVDLGTGPHLNPARAANPQTRQAVLRELRGDLEMFNLKIADLYLMLPRISVNDEKKRSTDIMLFKAMLPFAQTIRVAGITVSPGLVHPEDDEEAWERTVTALREMLQAAQEAQIPLSVEPHLDSMASTPERALRLVEEIEGLQITLDIAHMACQGIRLKKFQDLLPHTRHVQIRQARRNKLQTAFDKGKIDLVEFFDALREVNYEGFLGIEYMQTVDWHGMQAVNSIVEVSRMRDELRTLREASPTT
ncbi:MAG: sugar phosphate isomerase/epimerase [Anaerolineae bacterium]|nr:sugar phosphate isomerase/epimerase [Anaerolineae bacterium]